MPNNTLVDWNRHPDHLKAQPYEIVCLGGQHLVVRNGCGGDCGAHGSRRLANAHAGSLATRSQSQADLLMLFSPSGARVQFLTSDRFPSRRNASCQAFRGIDRTLHAQKPRDPEAWIPPKPHRKPTNPAVLRQEVNHTNRTDNNIPYQIVL